MSEVFVRFPLGLAWICDRRSSRHIIQHTAATMSLTHCDPIGREIHALPLSIELLDGAYGCDHTKIYQLR